MGIFKGLAIAGAIAGVGAVIFAQKRSAETGRDIKEVMKDLPNELKGAGDDMKQRMKGAKGEYQKASEQKEAEIDQQLAEEEAKLETAKEETTVGAGAS
jgi:Sec-independent protein translocase protein TatA